MVLKFDMPVYYVVPLQKIARKNILKNRKIYGKIPLKTDGQIVLKLTKFAQKLHACCMVVVYKRKKS